jgi:ABC-type glycerol-3-phosphate transport system substrate-binding protein
VNIRALASTTLAATLLLGTAGCGIFVDAATLKPYSASDGLNVDVGGLQLRNVLVITDESGDASLVFTVVNNTTEVQNLAVQFRTGTPVDLAIVANEGITKVGLADDNPAIATGTALKAGQYVDIYFQYGGEDGVLMAIPVLDGSHSLYAPYAPSLFVPEPVVSPSATPSPTPEG